MAARALPALQPTTAAQHQQTAIIAAVHVQSNGTIRPSQAMRGSAQTVQGQSRQRPRDGFCHRACAGAIVASVFNSVVSREEVLKGH
jgi:hypothetical protein